MQPTPTPYAPVDTTPRPVEIPDSFTVSHYHSLVDPFNSGLWFSCGSCLGIIMAAALLLTVLFVILAIFTLAGLNLLELALEQWGSGR